jgi:hemin uptake protein HemP
MTQKSTTPTTPLKPSQTNTPSIPTLSSHDILRGHKSVWIDHQGVRYRLQQTQLGKLILTK